MTKFEEEALAALALRGVTFNRDGEYVRIPGFTGPNRVSDESLRYMNMSAARGQPTANGRVQREWVEKLAAVVHVLDERGADAPWAFFSIFWVRLHGVIAELRADYRTTFEVFGVDPTTYTPAPGSDIHIAFETFRYIEAVRTRLTDDELIYADYRRQTEAHPTQASYDVRWSRRRGAVLDRRGIPALDNREHTVEEMDAAIERVVSAHANENAIAVNFARRVRAAVDFLAATMRVGSPTGV